MILLSKVQHLIHSNTNFSAMANHYSKKKVKHTCWKMQIFVNVKNCVTSKATLPGIESIGIRKLICDTITTAIHGR